MNWRAGSSRQINPGFPGCCARGTKRGAKSPSAFPLRCTVATASYVTLRKGTLLPLLVPVFPVQAMPGKGALVKSTLGSLAAVRVGPKEARKAHRPSHCGAAYAREAVRSTNDQLEDVYETCEGLQPRDVDKWRREYQRDPNKSGKIDDERPVDAGGEQEQGEDAGDWGADANLVRPCAKRKRPSAEGLGCAFPTVFSRWLMSWLLVDPPPSWSLRTTLKDMAHEPLSGLGERSSSWYVMQGQRAVGDLIAVQKTKESLVFDEIRRVEEAASAAGPAPHAPQPPAPQAPVGGHAQVQRSWLAFLARTDIGCPCRPPSAQQRQRRKLVATGTTRTESTRSAPPGYSLYPPGGTVNAARSFRYGPLGRDYGAACRRGKPQRRHSSSRRTGRRFPQGAQRTDRPGGAKHRATERPLPPLPPSDAPAVHEAQSPAATQVSFSFPADLQRLPRYAPLPPPATGGRMVESPRAAAATAPDTAGRAGPAGPRTRRGADSEPVAYPVRAARHGRKREAERHVDVVNDGATWPTGDANHGLRHDAQFGLKVGRERAPCRSVSPPGSPCREPRAHPRRRIDGPLGKRPPGAVYRPNLAQYPPAGSAAPYAAANPSAMATPGPDRNPSAHGPTGRSSAYTARSGTARSTASHRSWRTVATFGTTSEAGSEDESDGRGPGLSRLVRCMKKFGTSDVLAWLASPGFGLASSGFGFRFFKPKPKPRSVAWLWPEPWLEHGSLDGVTSLVLQR
ncbi:hypothetical protein C8R47DRAFT_1084750 [Mycena vitilis]|nr:hypothetical protein C8R47DRAFT_1084750 [Mycena vitilis]